MGLLDGFEKLLNEHGSATILKERIALANDKYALLEEKNKSLTEENEKLKKENEKNFTRILQLEEELKNSRTRIEETSLSFKDLPEILEKILLQLANYRNSTDQEISRRLGIGLEVVKFHLTELKKKKMVDMALTINSPCEWYLIQEGQGYLIQRGLIK